MNRLDFYQKAAALAAARTGSPVHQPTSVRDLEAGFRNGALLYLPDILTQLETAQIHSLLEKMAAAGTPFLAVVSTYYSDIVLDDGSNLSKTVQPSEWWLRMFREHFDRISELPTFLESDVVVTNAPLAPEAAAELQALLPNSSTEREFRRFFNRLTLFFRLATGGTVSQPQLFRDLEGKKVALVGNARSLADTSHGREIDAHDLVIRFNRVPIVGRRSHGFRTDWVASGVPLGKAHLDNLGATRLLWLSAFRRKMTADTLAVADLYVHPARDLKVLVQKARVERPSTGLTAIDLLSRSPVRAVNLYGFDFYASQSSSSHQTVETAPHAYDREEDFVRRLLEQDKRFRLHR